MSGVTDLLHSVPMETQWRQPTLGGDLVAVVLVQAPVSIAESTCLVTLRSTCLSGSALPRAE